VPTGRFVSYAQNHEDVVLARALDPDDHAGFWIDVGAGDPVIGSVTAAFAERGWRGINVEPLRPEYESLCSARPHDVNLDVLDVSTLADVVASHVERRVDFLRIGLEGSERQVLESLDRSSVQPRIVIVEAGTTRTNHPEWESMLLDQGYTHALFDGLNRFYAREDDPTLVARLSAPANVLDDFVPHLWHQRVCDLTTAADEAAEAARQAEHVAHEEHDARALAWEEIERLRADLDAAQRVTAEAQRRAMALIEDEEAAQAAAAAAREELERVRAEHAALVDSRSHRYRARLRDAYGRVRRGTGATER